uniref:Uncharacterized protein n=1 Tax=Arundo donax TaxID=35708 RepID=A0A0A9HA33_ARUDO
MQRYKHVYLIHPSVVDVLSSNYGYIPSIPLKIFKLLHYVT